MPDRATDPGRSGSSVFGRRGLPAVPLERSGVSRQRVVADRLPQFGGERQIVMQVVNGVEPRPEDFIRSLQMMKVGSAEVAAGVAVAALIERIRVGAVAGVAYLDVAVARVQPAVAGIARRQHAIEHVDAVSDSL